MPSQPAQAAAPVPPAQAPDLATSIEAGLRCAIAPAKVFSQCRDMPVPGYASMLLAATFWACVGIGLALVFAVMRSPVDVGAVPLLLSIACMAVLAIPLTFLGAGLLHALALLSGAQAGFDRSYQIVSLLAVMAPVAAAAAQFQMPFVWLAPGLYLTFLAIRAVEVLHRAPGAQAWLVLGFFGLLAVAGQAALHEKSAQFQRTLGHLVNIYSTVPKAADARPSAQARSWTPEPAEPVRDPWPERAESVPPAHSGIDMIRQPGDAQAGGEPPVSLGSLMGQPIDPAGSGLPSRAELDGMRTQALDLFSRINRQFQTNPTMLEGLPAEQRSALQKLMSAAGRMAEAQPGATNALRDPEVQTLIQGLMGMAAAAKSSNAMPPARARPKARPASPPAPEQDGDEPIDVAD